MFTAEDILLGRDRDRRCQVAGGDLLGRCGKAAQARERAVEGGRDIAQLVAAVDPDGLRQVASLEPLGRRAQGGRAARGAAADDEGKRAGG